MARSNLGENEERGWSLGGVPDYVPPPPGPRPWLAELTHKIKEKRDEREVQKQARTGRKAEPSIAGNPCGNDGSPRPASRGPVRGCSMSLRNLSQRQLDEDYYFGDAETRESIIEERKRRADEQVERACRWMDERKDK